ncbi:unnamed protein product [Rotaria sp. Silwood2]|nr:unnamed protein product [Rotaria sp. Silwood2]CAF4636591.1 unnamed protein product [Rotaria sp. Silwood2]
MWQSNPNVFSNSEPAEWNHYSDVENLIIEGAYSNGESKAVLDEYYIDFKANLQISNTDEYKQRPVKRLVRKREDKHLREQRFVDLPVSTGRSFSDAYGWVPPFVIEARKYLKLEVKDLPSRNPKVIPMLIDKAADGIIQESKHIGKDNEGKELANMLKEQKNQGIQEVWKCCAFIYSLESFLYKTLNAAMRLVGDEYHDYVWRSKVHTLGPFCLFLWDDPYNSKLTTNKTLYRGANLNDEQIARYEEMSRDRSILGSFQAFTSSSRNRTKAEEFGNTLFIMEILIAFTADLSNITEYPNEEEELITPGVCFQVTKVQFDRKMKKSLIYLKLRQRFTSKQNIHLYFWESLS